MSVQTGLAPPNTGRAKPVCADIRTTPYNMMSVVELVVVFMVNFAINKMMFRVMND